MKEYTTKTEKETRELAKDIAKSILKGKFRILALKGDLGGGKTSFVQGLAKGLGIKEDVLSPTFVIFRKLKAPFPFEYFYHFDCYRIKDSKEILDLGFKEIINNPKNIIVVEWAEKIEDILPRETLVLNFEFLGKNKRKITPSSDL